MCFVSIVIATILGIAIGISEASLWALGLIPTVRAIIPYAAALAMLIFALTPILAMWARTISRLEIFGFLRNCCLGAYTSIVMIAATIFLIFVQVFVGTLLPMTVKIALAFLGSISFWVMLIVFLFMVFRIVRNR